MNEKDVRGWMLISENRFFKDPSSPYGADSRLRILYGENLIYRNSAQGIQRPAIVE